MESKKTGKIYILRNPYLKDAVIKIGRTSRITEARAKEISSSTGVPFEYEVLYEEDVLDSHLAEKLIHEILNLSRINKNREFFKIPLKTAVKAVFKVCLNVNKDKLNQASTRLLIVFNSKYNKSSTEKLSEILSSNKGDMLSVHILYESENEKTLLGLGEEWNINLSASMINDIKQIRGVSDVLWASNDKDPIDFIF